MMVQSQFSRILINVIRISLTHVWIPLLSDEILERAVLPGHEEPLRVHVAVNLEAVEQLVDELAERLRVQTLGGRPVP
jgi:hypothetical protein